jgi:hypothetical protein
VELRHFSQGDWLAFLGCETASPLIGRCGEVTIVIDGPYVEMFDDGGDIPGGWKFPDHGTAVLFAMGLRGDEAPDQIRDRAAALGF